MLVVPGVGVVMSSLPGVRGVLVMRLMIVLMMAVSVTHVQLPTRDVLLSKRMSGMVPSGNIASEEGRHALHHVVA
jgi:hypothetical protein